MVTEMATRAKEAQTSSKRSNRLLYNSLCLFNKTFEFFYFQASLIPLLVLVPIKLKSLRMRYKYFLYADSFN